MKLKFYPNLNIEKFTRLITKSCGNVLLRLSDNSTCDLKTDQERGSLIRKEMEQGRGIEILLTDVDDCARFTKLMIGAYV